MAVGFEGLGLIDGCCCGNSAAGLVPVEVFDCHLVLLGIFEEGLKCDFLAVLLGSYPLLDLKMLCGMKKVLFDIPSLHLCCHTIISPILDALD